MSESLKEAAKLCVSHNQYSVILVNVDSFDVDNKEWLYFMQHNLSKTPIIACGEKLNETTFELYKEKGFSFWLDYPLEAERLIAAVRIFIN